MQIVDRANGSRAARDCECRLRRRELRTAVRANIPLRYQESSLDNFRIDVNDDDHSLSIARFKAKKFVQAYPLETGGRGMLITGKIGTGKTHLAVGILKALVAKTGCTGSFYHYHDLLKQVLNSYNRQVQATEMEILEPIFKVDLLVMDELGATKPTDWVSDTVAHILNTRYNERRTTIITTNYPNAEPLLKTGVALTAFAEGREAMRDETLGDRIGERMRSRLQEMCYVIEMTGVDYRQTINRARFGD